MILSFDAKEDFFSKTPFFCKFNFFFLELEVVLIQCKCFISLPHGWKISFFPMLHTGVCDIPLSHDLSDATAVLHILGSGGIKKNIFKSQCSES